MLVKPNARRALALSAIAAASLWGAASRAADPAVDECMDAKPTIGEKDRRVELVAPAASTHAAKDSPQRPVGLVIGGVGLAGLALGGIFAVLAKTTDAHALADECGGNASTCSIAGIEDGNRAHAEARTSTIALIGGGLLLGTGALIYFTAPGRHLVSVGGSAGADHAGLSLNGEFL
jgi:hypothetical protein